MAPDNTACCLAAYYRGHAWLHWSHAVQWLLTLGVGVATLAIVTYLKPHCKFFRATNPVIWNPHMEDQTISDMMMPVVGWMVPLVLGWVVVTAKRCATGAQPQGTPAEKPTASRGRAVEVLPTEPLACETVCSPAETPRSEIDSTVALCPSRATRAAAFLRAVEEGRHHSASFSSETGLTGTGGMSIISSIACGSDDTSTLNRSIACRNLAPGEPTDGSDIANGVVVEDAAPRAEPPATSLWQELHTFALCLSQSCIMTVFVTTAVKYFAGRHRPDFISRLQRGIDFDPRAWDMDNATQVHIMLNMVCDAASDNHEILDGMTSFPSGHSSLAFAGWLVPVMYILVATGLRTRLGFANAVVCMLMLCIPSFVAVSRTRDNRHHWSDVLAGSILGIAFAVLAFYVHYSPHGVAPLNSRTEGTANCPTDTDRHELLRHDVVLVLREIMGANAARNAQHPQVLAQTQEDPAGPAPPASSAARGPLHIDVSCTA